MLSQREHSFSLRPLGPLPPEGNLTPAGDHERSKGDVELNLTAKKVLEAWFPARKALVTQRGGSGRQTSARMLNLQLRYGAVYSESRLQVSIIINTCIHASQINVVLSGMQDPG
jgi:hypothetical protein